MFAAINTFLSGGASAPLNTVAPAVTGTAASGQTLSCTTGTWTGSLPITYTYQWQHGTTNIASATSSTYVLDRSYIGETIRCVVTATNAIGVPTANSNATSAVVAVPLNTVAPAVTGTATNGQTLTSSTGTWTGTATISFAYQWKRGGTNVGSNSTTYALVDADVGSAMSCVVTGTNGQGSATGTSNSTGSIAATVPGAPTIGTATQTGSTTATVAFTAPSSNGGATITTYTAYSGGTSYGTLSQAGSGTINCTGLTANTAYTFTVKATNSAGQSSASSASNSITTSVAPGQAVYTTNTTWTAPAGVTSVSVVAVGPGAGALAYRNNITVVPGNSYTVGGSSFPVYFINTATVSAGRNSTRTGDGGGNSGNSPAPYNAGGGAGGYSGSGGNAATSSGTNGTAGSGGGGGGGGRGNLSMGAGGGVGLLGEGSSGGAGTQAGVYSYGGGGGSGGGTGGTSFNNGDTVSQYSGYGGQYGGDVGADGEGGTGGDGGRAIRIIWPGTTRQFPSTNTGDM